MDFHNFDTVYVFKVKKSIADISTELPTMFAWSQKSKSTSGSRWFCRMNSWNFHTIHVFEIRESMADISTELLCFVNLKNPGKLPVQDVLGGTGDCVL